MLPLKYRLKQNFLFDLEKSIDYLTSAVNRESSNPCIGPLLRMTISLFLSPICTDELISTPKIMTYLPALLSDNENS